MEQTFAAETVATPDKLFEILSNLTTYPHWLDVVSDVVPDVVPENITVADTSMAAESGLVLDDAERPAWIVTLQARVGPFARSKRLRMVQTSLDLRSRTIVFDRLELDGRDHSAWQLHAVVEPRDNGQFRSASVLRLSYGGAMWSGILDGILDSAAKRATISLQEYAARQ